MAATFGSWRDERSAVLPFAYIDKVRAAGGEVLLVPPGGDSGSLIGRFDALLLSGGADVDPARYGQAREDGTDEPDVARDESELALLSGARALGLPVLAICRGAQLVNVAFGGTLLQHLPDRVGHDDHRPSPGVFGHNAVRLERDSLLAAVLEGDAQPVACHHHQAIDKVGDGLRPVGAAKDGTIEALEVPGEPLIAVQWHPERGADGRLFSWLVDAAR